MRALMLLFSEAKLHRLLKPCLLFKKANMNFEGGGKIIKIKEIGKAH